METTIFTRFHTLTEFQVLCLSEQNNNSKQEQNCCAQRGHHSRAGEGGDRRKIIIIEDFERLISVVITSIVKVCLVICGNTGNASKGRSYNSIAVRTIKWRRSKNKQALPEIVPISVGAGGSSQFSFSQLFSTSTVGSCVRSVAMIPTTPPATIGPELPTRSQPKPFPWSRSRVTANPRPMMSLIWSPSCPVKFARYQRLAGDPLESNT